MRLREHAQQRQMKFPACRKQVLFGGTFGPIGGGARARKGVADCCAIGEGLRSGRCEGDEVEEKEEGW